MARRICPTLRFSSHLVTKSASVQISLLSRRPTKAHLLSMFSMTVRMAHLKLKCSNVSGLLRLGACAITLTYPWVIATGLSAGLQASSAVFHNRFDQTFSLASKGFDAEHVQYAQALTSSMLGGIGYFYGTSIVDKHFRHEYDLEDEEDEDNEFSGGQRVPRPELVEPKGLYTATPSRSFFPRGFYWYGGTVL